MSARNDRAAANAENVDCFDIVNQTLGLGAVEIENVQTQHGPCRRQISNLSLPKKKSDIGGACSNLVNSIVGAGIIGIPFALKESGLVAGIFLLLLVSYFTEKSLRMLVELAHFHPRLKGLGVLTFEDLMMLPFGIAGSNFVLASMLICAYGAMVAYLLIIKDTVPTILGLGLNGNFIEREVTMIVTSFVIVVPLSMQRDMSSLAFTSLISCVLDTLLVVFVSVFSPVKESVDEAGGIWEVIKDNGINSGFFIGFGVLTVAMMCQHSAFIVSGSLVHLNSQRWAIVTFRSLSIACLLCAILGIYGYLGFLNETKGDLLNNFDPGTFQANAARVLLALTMFFTYPMESMVARHVLLKLLYKGDIDGHATIDPSTGEEIQQGGCVNRRVKWTVIIYIATLLPALFVDDLGPVLSITGAIGGCCLAYIGPGLVYLGTHGDSFLEYLATIVDDNYHKPNPALMAGELPVAGYVDASLETSTTSTILTGPKPWWWNFFLMPLWVRVAEIGANGMQERLKAIHQEHGTVSPGHDNVESIGPCKRDYCISIFFIVFGTIAGVAGVLTNVYVQINNALYTPS